MSDEAPQPPDGSVQMPQLAVRSKAAAVVADLASITADLRHTAAACRLIADQDDDSADGVVTRALWESAVVSYGRCFQSGKGHIEKQSRTPMPTEVMATLTDEDRLLHDRVMQTRNQHVAHRADLVTEQARVLVFLNAPPHPPEAVGAGPFMLTLIAPTEDVKRLAELADRLAGQVDEFQQPLLQAIVEEVNQDIPAAYDAAHPRYRVGPPETPGSSADAPSS